MQDPQIKSRLKTLKCCVLVPTYNNARTLARVLDGVLQQTEDLIVVNDGSTDGTAEILTKYPQIKRMDITHNKGKGNALRLGFALASNLGFEYAITIDSDGQHFPEDIPIFVEALESSKHENILLVGERNMDQKDIPKKSSFGHKFSNFWFWFETAIHLPDTQSGFRLYPLKALEKLKLKTHKFEFEIEVLVKAAWAGVLVSSVPVRVTYDKEERVSHFRPFQDFSRVSLMNTYLVIIAIFYIKPRDFIRKMRKKGIKRFFYEDILGSSDSPKKKALSIALGIFIGISPFWGFHTLSVIFLAIYFKLNKVLAFAFSNLSLPPFIPFFLLVSLQVGYWVLGRELDFVMDDLSLELILRDYLSAYLLGSLVLATVAAVVFGLLFYLFLSLYPAKNKPAMQKEHVL